MRKSFTIIALAALVMLAGCKKNEQQNTGTKLTAGIEQHKSDSKTSLNPDDLKISWTTGDKIMVNNGSEPKEFTLSSVDGEGRGEFACTGDYSFGATNVAVYPYDENTTVSGNTVTMTLPAVQNATVGTFGNGANPMLATFTDPEGITFTSLCGALCLQLTGEASITAIEIMGGPDDKLNGTFTADYTNPVLTYSENGTNTVRLNCEATLTATAQKFYVVLPAGTLNGFTMKVYNGDNVIFTKSTTTAITFQANYVETMAEMTVTTGPTVPEGAVKGLYSVRPNFKVYFSMGNLQYQRSTQTWRFAENPWDFVGGSYTMVTPNITCGNIPGSTNNSFNDVSYNGWMDLFGWGTGNNPTNDSDQDANYNTFNDWGANPISNGGNTSTQWRTLAGGNQEGYGQPYYGDGTYGEWNYLLYVRDASTVNGVENARFAKATVNGVAGLIIFADVYTHPSDVDQPVNINTSACSFDDNDYDATEWGKITDAGAAFLPAASFRYWYAPYGYPWQERHWEIGDGVRGYYWASYGKAGMSPGPTNIMFGADTDYSYYNTVSAVGNYNNNNGMSIRLVRDYEGNN